MASKQEFRVMFIKNWTDFSSGKGVFHQKGSFIVVDKKEFDRLKKFNLIQG